MLGSLDSSLHCFQVFVGDGVSVVSGFPWFLEGRFQFVRRRGVVYVGFLVVFQDRVGVDGQVLWFQNCLALVEEAFMLQASERITLHDS